MEKNWKTAILYLTNKKIYVIIYTRKELLPIAKRSYKRVKKNKAIGGIQLTNYQINQMAVSKLPDMEDFEESKQKIREFYTKEQNQFCKYYMLLCRDTLNYYTLLHRHIAGDFYNAIVEENLEDVVIECLQNIGPIKMIEPDGEKVECWVQTPNGCVAVYLFPYDEGVIEVR